TPMKGQDYYLPSPGGVPMKEHHDIGLYLRSVREQPWHALAGLSTERRTDDAVVHWLKSSNQIIGLTVTGLEWLNQALIYVLKKRFERRSMGSLRRFWYIVYCYGSTLLYS